MREEYIEAIKKQMESCDDISTLELIYFILIKQK